MRASPVARIRQLHIMDGAGFSRQPLAYSSLSDERSTTLQLSDVLEKRTTDLLTGKSRISRLKTRF